MSVSIVTDSAASLPADLAARHDITVVPLSLTLGGISYHDGDLSLAELLSRLDEGVTTSAPSPGEVAKAIEERLGDDGVLVLTIAGTMSGTFHAAHVASWLVDGTVRARHRDRGGCRGPRRARSGGVRPGRCLPRRRRGDRGTRARAGAPGGHGRQPRPPRAQRARARHRRAGPGGASVSTHCSSSGGVTRGRCAPRSAGRARSTVW